MMRNLGERVRRAAAAIVCGAVLHGATAAEETPAPRTVLALHDGAREPAPRATRIHRFLELPLNHLGYRLDYVDLAAGLPEPPLDPNVAAVVTWFDAPPEDGGRYLAWADRVIGVGGAAAPRFVAFGAIGMGGAEDAGQALLEWLGVRREPGERWIGVLGRVVRANPAFIGFEAEFWPPDRGYPAIVAAEGARSLLRVDGGSEAAAAPVDLVVLGPGGGYVQDEAALRFDPDLGQNFWLLEPFAFLAAALDVEMWPRPDPTTLTGRRIAFATADSTGWLAQVAGGRVDESPPRAARILHRDLIAPFPELPLSVSVTTGDFEPTFVGAEAARAEAAARAIFAERHVEAGVEGHTGPLLWSAFGPGDAKEDAAARTLAGAALRGLNRALGFNETGPGRATAGGRDRRHPEAPFDLWTETKGAVEFARRLMPEGKEAAFFRWSGDAKPFPDAIVAVGAEGLPSLGGGGGRFDAGAPSISNLWPHSARVGGQLQVYDALAGDAQYTGYWRGALHGLQRLADTLARTEAPRRLKAAQLAFSAQSAVWETNRVSVRARLEAIREGPYVPISASAYAAIVRGFDTARLTRIGPAAWRVRDRGALQTLRFDAAEDWTVAVEGSEGVVGERRVGGALYVALDPAVREPVVRLREWDRAAPARAFTLIDSRWPVDSLRREGCAATFRAQGFGPGSMRWRSPVQGQLRISLRSDPDGALVHWDETEVAANGIVAFSLPPQTGFPIWVRLDGCAD